MFYGSTRRCSTDERQRGMISVAIAAPNGPEQHRPPAASPSLPSEAFVLLIRASSKSFAARYSDRLLAGGYSPSNRALRESAGQPDDPEVGVGSRHTLKRISVSIVLDRSVLLSSKSLKQSPQSYAPR